MQIRRRNRRSKQRRQRLEGAEVMRRGVFLLPSLITTGSLFFGFMSIVRSFNGEHLPAAICILIAAVFDFFDGYVARLTNSATSFGQEYDSLSDLTSFGLAPALLAYSWALQPFERFGWLATFLFIGCAALRLARFNVQAGDIEKNVFQGLPTPAAAGLIASWVMFHAQLERIGILDPDSRQISIVLGVYGLAFLMVSPFRYRNLKRFSTRVRHSFFYLVLSLMAVVIVVSEPYWVLFPVGVLYVLHGPLGWVLDNVRERHKDRHGISNTPDRLATTEESA